MKNKKLQSLYHILIHILGPARVFPVERTAPDLVKKLIKRLHPVANDRGLIRLGPKGDGGYLVPDDLNGLEACFSPGVSDNSSFEKACAELGMQVYLADASVDGPAEQNARFSFVKKFVGATSSDLFMTIDDWVRTAGLPQESDLLMQMDIEGYEYETILSIPDRLLSRFRVLVIEFHHLRQLWNRPFFRVARPAFEKILHGHTCVHIHPNNCAPCLRSSGIAIPDTMEFTFLRNDRLSTAGYSMEFPHPLDCDNTSASSVVLPDGWFNSD